MSATRIQLHIPLQQIENDPPLKPQAHQLRTNSRGQTKQVRVQRQSQPTLKHPLQMQVPVGKRIPFLSFLTLFQALLKILLRRTGNTGPRSVPDLAATTGFKTGTISACLASTQPASANN